MTYYIKQTKQFGRGLYASCDISSNKRIFIAELLVLSPEDSLKVNETALQFYTFKYNDIQDCLVLGDGELFNHSDSANVAYRLVNSKDGTNRLIMEFYSIRPIKHNEQLFIDYNLDTKVNVNNYNTNLIAGNNISLQGGVK